MRLIAPPYSPQLARLKAYPWDMAFHTRLILGDSWTDLIFPKNRPENGLVSVLPEVRKHVHFLEPQRLEDFMPQHRYDMVVATALFEHMNEDQVAASLKVIRKMGAEIVIFTKKKVEHLEPIAPYVDVLDDPRWHATLLGQELALARMVDAKKGLTQYNIWVQKPA